MIDTNGLPICEPILSPFLARDVLELKTGRVPEFDHLRHALGSHFGVRLMFKQIWQNHLYVNSARLALRNR